MSEATEVASITEGNDMLQELEWVLEGTGWSIVDDYTLECPCGYCLELDGDCPECGENPLRMNGMV